MSILEISLCKARILLNPLIASICIHFSRFSNRLIMFGNKNMRKRSSDQQAYRERRRRRRSVLLVGNDEDNNADAVHSSDCYDPV